MEFLGFEAYITIDGVKVPHYEVRTDKLAKTATCWIASEECKPFAINWRPLKRQSFDIGADVTLDGFCVLGIFRPKSTNLPAVSVTECVPTSSTSTRPLLFASIQPTDDEDYLSHNLKDLGSIVVSIWHVGKMSEEVAFPNFSLVDEKIHERSKKAMGHKVKLGEETGNATSSIFLTDWISKLVTFTFKYRPIDILTADGIAPPTTAQRKGVKRNFNETDEDDEEGEDPVHLSTLLERINAIQARQEKEQVELKALLEQINAIQPKLAKKGPKPKTSKKIKTEPRTKPPFAPREVIDLT